VLKGFKNFMMQGEVIVIAVGLVVALAFSTLIKSFTGNILSPLINALAGGSNSSGLGWTVNGQRVLVGDFLSDVIYFVVFMAVIYFVIVVPYRAYMAKLGTTVFGPPTPSKSCPACQSGGLPLAATKCKFCASDLPAA
jgi:large conductance mechanosensitive channel